MKPALQFIGYFIALPILSPVIIVGLVMWISKWLTDDSAVGPSFVSHHA